MLTPREFYQIKTAFECMPAMGQGSLHGPHVPEHNALVLLGEYVEWETREQMDDFDKQMTVRRDKIEAECTRKPQGPVLVRSSGFQRTKSRLIGFIKGLAVKGGLRTSILKGKGK